MKHKFFLFLLFFFLFIPFGNINCSEAPSLKERQSFIRRYIEIQKKIREVRWFAEKDNLEEKINAMSYLVLDVNRGTPLLSKNENHSYPIASITKLMSAVVAVENIDIDQKVTLAPEMFLQNSWQRPSPAIYAGQTLAVSDLIKASLIQSTNNAVHPLTHLLDDGLFLEKMNETAKKIGMTNTRFYDAHGVSSLNRSTAPDILKLMTYVLENHPNILKTTTEENFQLPGNCPQHNWICTFKNLNTFHNVEGFLGGKSGFTNAAGNTFTGIFEINGKKYSLVLLNTKSRTTDTQNISAWLKKRP